MSDRRPFPKTSRLRRSAEVRAMFRSRTRVSHPTFDVYVRPAAAGRNPRVAVVVPKHGRTIVARNRLKRRIRELLRLRWLPAERGRPAPRDLLIRARGPAYTLDFAGLESEFEACLAALDS